MSEQVTKADLQHAINVAIASALREVCGAWEQQDDPEGEPFENSLSLRARWHEREAEKLAATPPAAPRESEERDSFCDLGCTCATCSVRAITAERDAAIKERDQARAKLEACKFQNAMNSTEIVGLRARRAAFDEAVEELRDAVGGTDKQWLCELATVRAKVLDILDRHAPKEGA